MVSAQHVLQTKLTYLVGFIASHVTNTLLATGYRVRGTVRSADKLAVLQDIWEKKYGQGKFEVAVVPSIEKAGALDEALVGKLISPILCDVDVTNGHLCYPGVSGVAHIATITGFHTDPSQVIDPIVNVSLSVMKSCASQPSVKSVVFTSSSVAASWFQPGVERDIGEDSWNDVSVENAHSLPADDPLKPWHIYAASKVLGERAAWNFYKENKLSFVLNTVVPSFTMGPMFEPDVTGSTPSWIKQAFLGDWSMMQSIPPREFSIFAK